MIENKIEQSGLVNIDLETFYPAGPRKAIDLKNWLWHEQILKEKDFRDHVSEHDWEQYRDAFVAVYCSADAIIPVWAFMLISARLNGISRIAYAGLPDEMENHLFLKSLEKLDIESFRSKKVLVKGCSNLPVPPAAYLELTRLLAPVVSSLMYGEACSTVPVFKSRKPLNSV